MGDRRGRVLIALNIRLFKGSDLAKPESGLYVCLAVGFNLLGKSDKLRFFLDLLLNLATGTGERRFASGIVFEDVQIIHLWQQ